MRSAGPFCFRRYAIKPMPWRLTPGERESSRPWRAAGCRRPSRCGVRTMAWPPRLLAGGLLRQGVDLDDIGAPIRELPHAGRPGADAGEIEHGEAEKSLRGVREGHSDISWPEPKFYPCG